MVSLSEGRALQLISETPEEFVEHTRRQLVRIYPAGSRTSSSNYSPFPYWSVGCQIVALNYQTHCKDMRLYRGFFRQNGNCGYVLKPKHLTDKQASGHATKKAQSTTHLTIRILSGQNLPKVGESDDSVVDPYVTIKIEGDASDSYSGRTAVVANNGFNPWWNEVFEVHLRSPELAVICFTVKDKQSVGSSRFIGSYALPVTSVLPGI